MEPLLYLLLLMIGVAVQYLVIRLAVTHAIVAARKQNDPRSRVSGYVSR